MSESKDTREIRREQLCWDIRVCLEEIERGETAALDMPEIKRKARARWGEDLRE